MALREFNERVAKVTQKMQIPIGDLLTMAKGFLGVQEGLDEKGGLAVALVSGPEGRQWEESVLCAVVPVSDYNKFIAPLDPKDPDAKITAVTVMGMNMMAARKGNFAVLAAGDKSETLEKILAAKADVTEEAKEFLIEKGSSLEFGARPLRRAIEQHLEDMLAEELLKGTFQGTESITVKVVEVEGDKKLGFDTTKASEPAPAVVAGQG